MTGIDHVSSEQDDNNGQNLDEIIAQNQGILDAAGVPESGSNYPDEFFSTVLANTFASVAPAVAPAADAAELIHTVHTGMRRDKNPPSFFLGEDPAQRKKPDTRSLVNVGRIEDTGNLLAHPPKNAKITPLQIDYAREQITLARKRQEEFGSSLAQDPIQKGQLGATAPVTQALGDRDDRARQQLIQVALG